MAEFRWIALLALWNAKTTTVRGDRGRAILNYSTLSSGALMGCDDALDYWPRLRRTNRDRGREPQAQRQRLAR